MYKTIFICFAIMVPSVLAFSKIIVLGGLFPEDDLTQKAFIESINAINRMRIETEEFSDTYFKPEVITITDDVFEVSQGVCTLVGEGIAALFGPHDKVSSSHVQSMCDTMDLPNIVARWDSELVRMKSINFYPHSETLSLIYLYMVTEFKWEKFTILYDSTEALLRMSNLLQRWDTKGYPVTLRYLGKGPDYRSILKKVKNSYEENIIIDCSYDILEEVLQQSQQVGILSDRHKIIITSLDLQTLDLDPYSHSGSNITGIRLLDPEDPDSLSIFNGYLGEMGLEDLSKMRTDWALMFDAIQLFSRAFKQLEEAVEGDVKALACDALDNWEHGASLSNFIRSTEMKGLTGLIKFHTNGFRSDFKLNIVRLTPDGLKTIGNWNSTNSIEWIPEPPPVLDGDVDLANQTFTVVISLLNPFNMLTESTTTKTGNDRYEGFAIDIIHELSQILHFNYTFVEQVDKVTGSLNEKTGKWSGMLGKIIDGEADLAITDLTILSDREKVVDFTMPFMHLGISILYKKPGKAAPSLFSFMSPLSISVWLCLFGALFLTSLLLFVIGRVSPAEWTNPYPCIENPEELENQFTFSNCIWFTIGSIMQQGSEIAPIGVSTRILATAWWFFCMLMTTSYTANLAAFLTIETIVRPIKSAEDLANLNGKIPYGAKRDGSTFKFFEGSNYSTYVKMYEYMRDHPEVLTQDNEEGRLRALNEDYAFLMESSSIDYIAQRDCNLTQIGGLLDNKGYGIAMRKRFPYRNKLNTAVLQMQESGILSELKKKWWNEKRGGGSCKDEASGSVVKELSLDNVGGVFLVLVVGVSISLLTSAFTMFKDVYDFSRKERVSVKKELKKELKFLIKCRGNVKPARRFRKRASSQYSSTRDDSPPYGFVPTVITTAHSEEP
ncbi:glutamate receptor ionotropic, kainate 3-like isoform X2 [Microplitis mediator]|uniref:glutamate receptor ionotropic, kainate 3-like isoform X2 n=1 Tax=Microplitis mediator TaxID=375433 RepID=UPI0025554A26|nr:glutamate receptor ionotropic, kainate 3-like isoform X2 [Microplitis mediator]